MDITDDEDIDNVEDIENLEVTTSDGKALDDAAKKEVISNIKYIIDQEDLANGTLTITKLDGNALDKDLSGGYDVAKAEETFKVNIVPVSGYKLSAFHSGKATYTLNEDGSYTGKLAEECRYNVELCRHRRLDLQGRLNKSSHSAH